MLFIFEIIFFQLKSEEDLNATNGLLIMQNSSSKTAEPTFEVNETVEQIFNRLLSEK